MALILGISSGPHDSGACLLRGGALLSAANEERFTRRKMEGRFPKESINYCVSAEGVELSDIAFVACGWAFGASSDEVQKVVARVAEEPCHEARQHMLSVMSSYEPVDQNVMARIRKGLSQLGVPKAKLLTYDHHLCHAAAALYMSPFPVVGNQGADSEYDGMAICCATLDGRGDFSSGKIVSAAARGLPHQEGDPDLTVLASTTMFDSLGFLWAFVTAMLGFKPFRHEGKLTGLAGHGVASNTLSIFEKTVGLTKDCNGNKWRITTHWQQGVVDNFQLFLASLENGPKQKLDIEDFTLTKELRSHSKEDIAAGLQAVTENIMKDYLLRNGFVSESSLLCLSGGVFANVRLNMRLRKDLPKLHRLFVCPNMGDGGLCVGAAMLAARDLALDIVCPRGSIFLGPEFSEEMIREALKPCCPDLANSDVLSESIVELRDSGCFAKAVAKHIFAGSIVGFFYGAMEFGPRALGHRSLLALATDHSINATLNARLRRTEFMPFAPVTLREYASSAYSDFNAEDLEAGRFMTMCYEASADMKAKCPAVVHVDGTARPQIVDDRDGLYFQVLREYHNLSGIHSLVNTSFNVHEEPIVCSPTDAVKAFKGGACDVLAMYPYIVVGNISVS